MPSSNPAFLEQLFAAHDIDLRRGALFDRAPGPVAADAPFDRAAGMLLGLAIGDALGHPAAALPPAERAARWGDMADYRPAAHAGGAAVGLPSAITQLAFWTLDDLVAAGRFRPKRVVDRWCAQPLFGPDATVRDAVRDAKAGVPWHRCGRRSSGAAAAARTAPLLLPHLATGAADLWADVALGAVATHNDSAALSSALGVAALLHGCLARAGDVPPAAWWAATFVGAVRDVEAEPFYRAAPLDGVPFAGTLCQRIDATAGGPTAAALTVAEAAARWGSGEGAIEALPLALHILARHGDDPEAAVVRAATHSAASDVVAAIVGACAGALHGAAAWPRRWIAGLAGRTGAADDGRVFALIDQARGRWGRPGG